MILAGAALLVSLLPGIAASAHALDIVPFASRNQSPVAQIFGLPFAGTGQVLPPGRFELQLTADMANDFEIDDTARESIVLDGESYRYNLGLRYGIGDRYEVGLDVPVVTYAGGFLDGFIEDWHRAFGLPDGGRTAAPRDRLLFRYVRDGVEQLSFRRSGTGLGDIRLSGGMSLFHDVEDSTIDIALRASVKVPTGDSDRLHGSGSTDVALWLAASEVYPTYLGQVAGFASAGGMAMTKGRVLRDQQRTFVGFGNFGLGWAPADWIAFKVQVDANTAYFSDSTLRELGAGAVQLVMGGTLGLGDGTALDLGVTEDILVNSAPDVGFHFALRQRF
jgi:hypothetical protein